MKRYDFAVFRDDQYVANALLTTAQAKRMETEGYRCIRTEGKMDTGLPVFRGGIRRSGYVARQPLNRGRWDR